MYDGVVCGQWVHAAGSANIKQQSALLTNKYYPQSFSKSNGGSQTLFPELTTGLQNLFHKEILLTC